MRKTGIRRWLAILLSSLLAFGVLAGCGAAAPATGGAETSYNNDLKLLSETEESASAEAAQSAVSAAAEVVQSEASAAVSSAAEAASEASGSMDLLDFLGLSSEIETVEIELNPDEGVGGPAAASEPEEEASEAEVAEGASSESEELAEEEEGLTVTEDGRYTSKEEVALYIHTYGHLPDNYITKNEAEDLGWVSSWGNLDEVAPGMSIGGNRFGNYEGLLPEARGRKYYECDIDFEGGRRNAKRIIYSNDGLIFYTEDHYKSFEQLY